MPIDNNRRATKAVLLRAALLRSSAGSYWQFETQDFPSQCQSVLAATCAVHPTCATEWGWSRVNKAFRHLKRIRNKIVSCRAGAGASWQMQKCQRLSFGQWLKLSLQLASELEVADACHCGVIAINNLKSWQLLVIMIYQWPVMFTIICKSCQSPAAASAMIKFEHDHQNNTFKLFDDCSMIIRWLFGWLFDSQWLFWLIFWYPK